MKRIAGFTFLFLFVCPMILCGTILASIFGAVRGVVHDPQHRPIRGAHVTLKADNSDWSQSQESGGDGEINFTAVPLGDYTVTVTATGFAEMHLAAVVRSDTAPVLHFELAIAGAKETVLVPETPVEATTETVTPTTLVSRIDIEETPGADRTNAMEMITDYTPAAYVTHDMLHMRGGHQVNWLIDGVPVPNTNIANNLGPQTTAIERMVSSTSFRGRVLSVTANAISYSPPAIFIRRTTRSAAAGIHRDLLTMRV
jgi:hypothetical protein